MNPNKYRNYQESKAAFQNNGISCTKLNKDTHWKVGSFNFFPTTHKWSDDVTKEHGEGIEEALKHLNKSSTRKKVAVYRTVEELFEIAIHSKETTLEGLCKTLHREIYK